MQTLKKYNTSKTQSGIVPGTNDYANRGHVNGTKCTIVKEIREGFKSG